MNFWRLQGAEPGTWYFGANSEELSNLKYEKPQPDSQTPNFSATAVDTNAAQEGKMAVDDATGGAGSLSQVKIRLSTRDPDLQLSEETGPILVATSKRTRKHMNFWS